jgi:uncharacterized protein YjbJ (UPF0337 family)
MDKDRVKGTMDDAAGRIKRQIGEWTDDPEMQVEGAAQQVKGKTEKFAGNLKDAMRDTSKTNPNQTDDDDDDTDVIDDDETDVRQNKGHVTPTPTPRR